MIKIRTGLYSNYQGVFCQVIEERSEIPTSQNELFYILCYDPETGPKLEGFRKHAFSNFLCKRVNISNLDNLFNVATFGKFKGFIVQVFEKNLPDPSYVGIGTNNSEFSEKIGLRKIDSDWYIKDVLIDDLSEIWEERSPALGLPMPKGLDEKEYIKHLSV